MIRIPLAFKLDEPNLNNRIYKSSSFLKELYTKKDGLFVIPLSSDVIDINTVLGKINNFFVKDNYVTFDIIPIRENDKLFKEKGLVLVPNGYGQVSKDNIVEDYTLISFTLISKKKLKNNRKDK